ncbi:MAG: hypothetical protein ACRYGK_01145 [Janthinobacterium lividum]
MKPRPLNVFAVRFIGFTPAQIDIIDHTLRSREGSSKPSYQRLAKDNLQDPDLFLIDATQVVDAAALRGMGVSPARPALLVGSGKDRALPAPVFHGRLDSPSLLLGLDRVVKQRGEVLARLPAAPLVSIPERRQRERLGSAAATRQFERIRRTPLGGGILVVEASRELADHVGAMLAARQVPVMCVASEDAACEHCRSQRIALVVINTATDGVDAYRLCAAIKALMAARVKIVFLLDPMFDYDPQPARRAGCDGFLQTPLTHESVASLLKRFLPGALDG